MSARRCDIQRDAGEALLSAERARALLAYDPSTGDIRWIVKRPGVRADRPAGWINTNGYRCLRIDGRIYRAHRLAWMMVTGAWPALQIDHENRQRADNRWDNLREATTQVNNENQALPHRSNTSGVRGVTWNKKDQRWVAQISVKGRHVHLGQSRSIAEAAALYRAGKLRLHPGYVP